MKILLIHADFIEYEPKEKALKDAEEVEKKKTRVEDCLVVFSSAEEGDKEDVTDVLKEINSVAKQVKANKIVIYPFVHLTSKPAPPKIALSILENIKNELAKDYETYRAPFGWYKSFDISCKGHPLSELSREINFDNPQHVITKESVSDNETYKKLISFLDQNKATYRLIDHKPEGRTEIVSPMRGNELSQAAKCIIITVRIGKNDKKYVLGVVPGDAKINLDAVKNLFKGTYASFTEQDIAEKLTSCVSGTILPLSFNPEIELVVDPSLLEKNDELFFNAARLDRSMALKTDDYKKIAKPRLEKIAKYENDETSEAIKKESTLKSEWFIIDTEGKMNPIAINEGKISGYTFEKYPKLEKLVKYEMAKNRIVDKEPPHIKLMKKLDLVGYEEGSDPGHFRYLPKGRLVKSLMEDFVTRKTIEYGGMEVETPIMYDYEHPALKSYLNRFPARQYTIETPNKKTFLRFAACFGQFLMAKDAMISYRNLPMRLYELTRYSFRVEQRGELAGLRRLRAFTMPDCHCFVKDYEQAKEEMMKRFELARTVNQGFGLTIENDLEFAVRVTKEFFDEHKDFVFSLIKKWGKPALVEIWDKRFFYFVLKYEWNFIDALDKASTLTTDQIDVENAERYGIQFTDSDNTKKYPLILHLSPSGAIERGIYAMLEKAQMEIDKGKNVILPLWLCPTQVRLCPINDNFIDYCNKLADELQSENIRVDVDDRPDSIGKKIRDAEMEWVPYIVVIGQKEVDSELLSIRIREDGKVENLTSDKLEEILVNKLKGYPYKPLSLPRSLLHRPIFVA